MPYTFTNGDTIVTGESLAAGLNESWTITANFTVVAEDLTGDATACVKDAPASGMGFYNFVGGNIVEDESDNIACVNLPKVNLVKTAVGPTLESNGTYTVVYTVTATNSGDATASYDLVDTFSPASGLVLSTATLTSYNAGTENSQSGILIGPLPAVFSNGAVIVTNESLAAGLNESWTITANFTVTPADITGDATECVTDAPEAGKGFYNFVGGNILEDESDNKACVNLPKPQINLAKTAEAAVNVGGNTWQVVYTITATNLADGSGVYDLIDTMMPGTGITPVIDASYPAIVYSGGEIQTGVIGTPPLANSGSWVTLEGLAGRASESWTVTARFTVNEQILVDSPRNGNCTLEADEQGTGYLNYVEGSESEIDFSDNEACVPHPLPEALVPTLGRTSLLLMILLMLATAGLYLGPTQLRRFR
jgi:hypothetical protein